MQNDKIGNELIENEKNVNEKKRFHPAYILAIVYVITVYLVPIMFCVMCGEGKEGKVNPFWFILAPILFGIINLVYVCKQKGKIDRMVLCKCSVWMKCLLLPFYLLGALLIVFLFLMMFTPVVIMMFFSPFVIFVLCVLGWLFMVGAAPFSIAYIVESWKQGIHKKVVCVIAAIAQFFFTVDVISVIYLAVKERNYAKMARIKEMREQQIHEEQVNEIQADATNNA